MTNQEQEVEYSTMNIAVKRKTKSGDLISVSLNIDISHVEDLQHQIQLHIDYLQKQLNIAEKETSPKQNDSKKRKTKIFLHPEAPLNQLIGTGKPNQVSPATNLQSGPTFQWVMQKGKKVKKGQCETCGLYKTNKRKKDNTFFPTCFDCDFEADKTHQRSNPLTSDV